MYPVCEVRPFLANFTTHPIHNPSHPTELARELHVSANRISQLIAGKRSMTADTALRLEKWLGVSAAFWMGLQNTYELDIACEKADDTL
jgi:addiction module HigA family antidote